METPIINLLEWRAQHRPHWAVSQSTLEAWLQSAAWHERHDPNQANRDYYARKRSELMREHVRRHLRWLRWLGKEDDHVHTDV